MALALTHPSNTSFRASPVAEWGRLLTYKVEVGRSLSSSTVPPLPVEDKNGSKFSIST